MATQSIADLILEVAADEEHRNDISLLPLMCGTGKSTAISELIGKAIREADTTGNGILIVTDRINRLYDYLKPRDVELKAFLDAHEDQITIMTHDNAREAYIKQHSCPVLMMTTQRYMKLPPWVTKGLLKWAHGVRPLVLIDERPEILTEVSLDDLALSECITALRETYLDDSLPDFWQRHFRDLDQLISCLPLNSAGLTDFEFDKDVVELASRTICQNACYFFTGNSDHKHTFEKKETIPELFEGSTANLSDMNFFSPQRGYMDIYERIYALFLMQKEKGLYIRYRNAVTQKGPDFRTAISTVLDHYDTLYSSNAKTIILDGTGDLSPEYIMHKFDIRDVSEYKRNLNHMTIRIVDYPTSRMSFYNKKRQLQFVDILKQYIKSCKINDPNMALFTYMSAEKAFVSMFTEEQIEHFGDIVGKNQFRYAKNIFQVGINRYPNTTYYLYYLAMHPEVRSMFEDVSGLYYNVLYKVADGKMERVSEDDEIEDFSDILAMQNWTDSIKAMINQTKAIQEMVTKPYSEVRIIMSRIMLAELEQNIFRGIIRNPDCDEDYTYHLFINVRQYPELIHMIRERYEHLGAKVVTMKLPTEVLIAKKMQRKGNTYEQRLINWHDNALAIGEEYTPARIRSECGFKDVKAFEQVVHRSQFIRKHMREENVSRGRYKKHAQWVVH